MTKRFAGQAIAEEVGGRYSSMRMPDAGRTQYVADTHNRTSYKTCPFCHIGRIRRGECASCHTAVPTTARRNRQ